jgi:hypothetical protein
LGIAERLSGATGAVDGHGSAGRTPQRFGDKVNGSEGLQAAFLHMSKDRIDALIVQASLPTKRAAELALKHRLPTASTSRWFAEEGGLMAYGWDIGNVVH